MGSVDMKEADGVELVSLVDNSIDFLSTIEQKDARSFRQWSKARFDSVRAEHGFAMLTRILSQGKSSTVLFDTGCSADGIVMNAKALGVNLGDVECIVLSHGHYDHFGGLLLVLKTVGEPNLPLIVHEDMFKMRGTGKK